MGIRDRTLAQQQERQDAKQARTDRDTTPDQQWEYLARNMLKVFGPSIEGDFNKLGEKGWEFVAMVQGGKEGYAIFKRRSH